jgi:hypothetical protein
METEIPVRYLVTYKTPNGPPLWSSGQSFWLQIQRSGFSLVRTTEELLERKSNGSGLENREFGRRELSRWPRGTLYPQNLALTSSKSCGRLVGIVYSLTQAVEFFLTPFEHKCLSKWVSLPGLRHISWVTSEGKMDCLTDLLLIFSHSSPSLVALVSN